MLAVVFWSRWDQKQSPSCLGAQCLRRHVYKSLWYQHRCNEQTRWYPSCFTHTTSTVTKMSIQYHSQKTTSTVSRYIYIYIYKYTTIYYILYTYIHLYTQSLRSESCVRHLGSAAVASPRSFAVESPCHDEPAPVHWPRDAPGVCHPAGQGTWHACKDKQLLS